MLLLKFVEVELIHATFACRAYPQATFKDGSTVYKVAGAKPILHICASPKVDFQMLLLGMTIAVN